MARRLVLIAAALCACAGAHASAQSTADAVGRCHSYVAPEIDDPDRAIAGCTAVIESPAFDAAERLDALVARGILFRKTGRFDLAVVDLSEALRIRPSGDDVYVERGMSTVSSARINPSR